MLSFRQMILFFFSGCFLLVLVVHKYSVLRTTSFKENNQLQRRCAQILISMSRARNPLYPIILPKVMANLCRGAPNTTEGIETSLTFPAKHRRRWSGCITSAKARLRVKTLQLWLDGSIHQALKWSRYDPGHPSHCHVVREGRRVHKSSPRLP